MISFDVKGLGPLAVFDGDAVVAFPIPDHLGLTFDKRGMADENTDHIICWQRDPNEPRDVARLCRTFVVLGLPDVVHGESGFLWDHPDELSACTEQLFDHAALWTSMSQNARQKSAVFGASVFGERVRAMVTEMSGEDCV